MKYVIKLRSGYYARNQPEFSSSLVEDINDAAIFYGTVEVESVVEDAIKNRQPAFINGYQILEIENEISIVSTHESKSADDVKLMSTHEALVDAIKKIDPEELAKVVSMIMERARKTKKKFDDLQRVPHHKLTKPFTR